MAYERDGLNASKGVWEKAYNNCLDNPAEVTGERPLRTFQACIHSPKRDPKQRKEQRLPLPGAASTINTHDSAFP